MADDTRQQPKEDLSKEALTIDKDYQAFSGDQWKDAKKDFRSAPANMLAGGKQNTAGGDLPEISISAAFDGGLKLEDITNFPYRPCVRDTLLQGLGSGFALGGGRLILRGTIFAACTWAVGGFVGVSSVMYQVCQYSRAKERDGMMRAVEILNQKEEQKKAREAYKEKQREERRKLKDAELDQQYAKLRGSSGAGSEGGSSSKPWWKVW